MDQLNQILNLASNKIRSLYLAPDLTDLFTKKKCGSLVNLDDLIENLVHNYVKIWEHPKQTF